METAFTEAARRALDRAADLADWAGATEAEPLHLLWALAEEESHAAETLQSGGLTHDVLKDRCPLPFDPVASSARHPDMHRPPISPSERLRLVVNEARARAALAGRHAEVGSEHLLLGLAFIDSPVALVLRDHGLHSEALAARVAEKTGFSSEPIAVDFDIRRVHRTETISTDTLRVIDAAANRAREGLRVLEDFVRFTLDDAHLTALLKECRHNLVEGLSPVDAGQLLKSRDTTGDVGTAISTETEMTRSTPIDVVRANFKRVQEAARTLEEFGKVLSPEIGRSIEQLRYKLYTVEKAVLLTESNRRHFDGRLLYLLVTEAQCHHGSGPAIREALRAGAGVIQLREKTMPDRRLLDYAKYVREWTREANALLIINDRPDLAVLADADGVHVGQEELSAREARRIVGPDRLVGVSTHTIEQARQAVLDGADYLGVGPVFASQTKGFDKLAGIEFVKQVAAEITLPWFAIGGINAENIGDVLDAGATRVAVSHAVCAAEDPFGAASKLLDALDADRK